MRKAMWAVLVLISFTLAGCFNSGIKLELQYDDLAGIQKGDWVLKENEVVGVVTKVDPGTKADGSGTVFVSVNQKKADSLTKNTRFYIDPDPEKEARQSIVLEQFRPGGDVLASGAVVQGSDRTFSAFHELADELGTGFGALKELFEGFKDELEKGSESDMVKKFEEELNILAQKMEESSEKWRQQFEQELLPELEKQLDALRESLEKLGKSDEVQKLKRQLEDLTET